VGATPRRRQERTLEVEAQRFGARSRCCRQPSADVFGKADKGRKGGRDSRRQERGDTVPQEMASHAVERFATAHRIVAATAVDVDIDEAGRDERKVGGSRWARIERLARVDGNDQTVLDPDPTRRNAIVEDQPALDRQLPHRQPSSRAGGASRASRSNWTSRA
jgi:hypothetical protein